MSWIGLRDQRAGLFETNGIGQPISAKISPTTPLNAGTVLMEFAAIPGEADQVLFRYAPQHPSQSVFEIRLTVEGDLAIRSEGVGYADFHVLETGFITRSNSAVFCLTWDAETNTNALSLQIMESGKTYFRQLPNFSALILRDAVLMCVGKTHAKIGAGVRFLGVADHAMPHGPLPSLAPSTLIPTPNGRRQVSELKIGDVVTTKDGSPAQVRWAGAIDVPAVGRFAPRRICAPFHNATADLICAHDQLLRLSGSEVEYLFATDHVLTRSGDLNHGIIAEPRARHTVETYAQIVLDRPAAVDVSGIAVEAMNIDTLMQMSAMASHSVLSGLPRALWPTPSAFAPEILQPFETAAWSKLQAA